MNRKEQTAAAKTPPKPKNVPAGPKALGPVHDLEAHVHPEWWRQIFNAIYLKTDGDVVDDPQLTAKEVDIFSAALALKPEDRILDSLKRSYRYYSLLNRLPHRIIV